MLISPQMLQATVYTSQNFTVRLMMKTPYLSHGTLGTHARTYLEAPSDWPSFIVLELALYATGVGRSKSN